MQLGRMLVESVVPTPCQTGLQGIPTLPGSGRRPRRRPALVLPGRSLGLGDTPRYFGGWKNSKAVGKAEARAGVTGVQVGCGGRASRTHKRAAKAKAWAERSTERSGVLLVSGNEVFALLGKTGTGQCLVEIPGPPGFRRTRARFLLAPSSGPEAGDSVERHSFFSSIPSLGEPSFDCVYGPGPV